MSDIPYSVRGGKPSISNLGGLEWGDIREEELIRKKDDINAEGAGIKVIDNEYTDTPINTYIKSQEYFMTLPSTVISMGMIKQTYNNDGYVMKLSPLFTINEILNEAGLYLKYKSAESDNVRVSINSTTADHEFSVGNSLKVDAGKVAINNSGTLNNVDFEVNNTFFVNSNTRRVGINEVDPAYTFQIGDFFYVNQGNQRVSIGTQPTDSYKLNVNGSLKNAGNLNLYNGLITAGETSNRILVKDNADNVLLSLDHDNRRVGIGILNPDEDLEVDGSIQIDSANVSRLKFQKSGASPHAEGEIDGETDGTNGGQLEFYTKEDGGSVTEKMRIKQNGRVGIGYTDPRETLDVNGFIGTNRGMVSYAESATDYRTRILSFTTRTGTVYQPSLYMGEVEGTVRHGYDFKYDFDGTGGDDTYSICRMYYHSGVSQKTFQVFADSWYPSSWGTSDDRLKTEETDITDGLSVVRQMSPEMYKKWDNFEHTGKYTVESGYIAQEIEAIPQLSHCVKELDGIKYINYDFLMAFHTASIKQLDTIQRQHVNTIRRLETRLLEVERQLATSN